MGLPGWDPKPGGSYDTVSAGAAGRLLMCCGGPSKSATVASSLAVHFSPVAAAGRKAPNHVIPRSMRVQQFCVAPSRTAGDSDL